MPAKPESQEPQPSSRDDTITTILMITAALVAITGFSLLFSRWWKSGVSDPYEVLRIASQEFVAGRPIVAGELAETVRLDVEPEPDQPQTSMSPNDTDDPDAEPSQADKERQQKAEWIRLRDFLVGAGRVAKAALEEEFRDHRRALLEAVPPLRSARDAGFPLGRQTEGNRMLGETLFKLGRYDDAIATLSEAIARDPTLRQDLLPMLAEAQLRSRGPRTDQALATIESHLSETPLQPRQAWPGQLIRIRCLIELKRYREASAAIDDILRQPTTSDVVLQGEELDFRNEVLLQRDVLHVNQAIDRYGKQPVNPIDDRSNAIAELTPTIESLDRLQREAAPRTSARARLWMARALLVQGLFDDALSNMTAVRQQRPFGAEPILGGLEEIELLSTQGRGVEMFQTTRYLMREIGDESGFDPDLVAFDEFRRRVIDSIEELRRRGDYANAIDTARSLPPVFSISEALTQEAIGYREWASATLDDGTDISGEVARSASSLARSRYRAAGDAFAQAAQLKFDTNEFLPAQWSAIDAYQKGRHFRRSVRLLEPYLRHEERSRQPRGLVAYGRALLAEGEEDDAIQAVQACIIEYPRDPLRYDARLLAALAYGEKKDLTTARDYLMQNLNDGELTPQSPAWRDSLFTLGEMLFERGYQTHLAADRAIKADRNALLRENQPILAEAVRYLDEAVDRYWPHLRAESAAYLSARAHVMASHWPRVEANSPELLEAARRSLRTQADQELQIALDGFVNLRKHLVAREEEMRLPAKEQAVLRNCFMAEADVLREMNRLEDAATAYRTVELRYMNEPLALEAILARARCAKELGRMREADLLVRQANIVLGRIPSEWDSQFAETTRFDREGWEQYLRWMNRRIKNTGV